MTSRDEAATTQSDKLSDGGIASHDDPVFEDDMSTKAGAGGHGAMIAYLAVMSNVGVGHEVVVAADSGWLIGLAAMRGEAFTEGIFITDDQPRGGVGGLEAQILGRPSQPGSWIQHVAMSDFSQACDPVLPHQSRS